MDTETRNIRNFDLTCYEANTLIIGSGAASLNAAVSLHSSGQKDIVIATTKWGAGTSNNAGSDKQTYYKLSLSGEKGDSVIEMARDLYDGKCMHGDIALCEAQGSVQAFMNLVSLGVPFPRDKYGSWAGYKTDNDPRSRATSAGPYTSKKMFEVLAGEVKRRRIKILDRHQVIALLTDRNRTKVIGALAINMKAKDPFKGFVLFNCMNIILGTGGPAGIYETSVYPLSQSGSIGMAFKAGATGQNLTESQFGIASTKFRWNLSGSYQQAIPRYISTDKRGSDRIEFLNDFFPDIKSLSKAIFMKGNQWPFDPRRIENHGSSLIDLLIFREICEKQRNVYIDYSQNPSFLKGESFSFENLDKEVFDFLNRSGALKESPLDRLLALNGPAYSLYKEHGIDLAREPLQVSVCVQHNNGGLKAGIWWESDLKHLFPVGEVNGSHGVYRPGGAALNSGQVGSYRAAQFISAKYNTPVPGSDELLNEAKEQIDSELTLAERWLTPGKAYGNRQFLREIRKRMSEAGGIIRSLQKVTAAFAEAEEMKKQLHEQISAGSVKELSEAFLLSDHCLTHYIYLDAIKTYLEKGGRSRGSYLVTENQTCLLNDITDGNWKPDLCRYDREIEIEILEVGLSDERTTKKLVKVREIPVQDLWFEKIWKDFTEDILGEC
ncbi:MAG: FAD-binding protein [Bacteroidia bacterium]|nr:FAD-binding protein [Bacteroidia bacterium]